MSATMVVGTLRLPSPNQRREVLEILRSVQGPVLAEPGCLACDVYEEQGHEKAVVLLERFETQEALEAHLRSEMYRRILGAIELSGGPPDIRFEQVTASEGVERIERSRSPGARLTARAGATEQAPLGCHGRDTGTPAEPRESPATPTPDTGERMMATTTVTGGSDGRVKVDKARVDRLKEQHMSTPQSLDNERVRIMAEVYESTAGYQQIIRRAKFFDAVDREEEAVHRREPHRRQHGELRQCASTPIRNGTWSG